MNRIKKMWAVNYLLSLAKILCAACFFCAASIIAQSTSVEYPTPVLTGEIDGKISARDLGDARLTSYYYTFNGAQGDIFINVAASNFNGDIDIFVADGLRPLSKIAFYADSSITETGRVIYLRKPEKLILRVQGRTPDDNPATFKIKFAGSFIASTENGNQPAEPKLPEINNPDAGGIRVNSVGTIIKSESPASPKPAATKGETIAANEETGNPADGETPKIDNAEISEKDDSRAVNTDETKSAAGETEKNAAAPNKRNSPSRNPRRRISARSTPSAGTKAVPKKTAPPVAAQPDPLENIRLVVLMKDGEKLEFPMLEVYRFSMNNGTLTITTKAGKIIRKSILDIQEFSVK